MNTSLPPALQTVPGRDASESAPVLEYSGQACGGKTNTKGLNIFSLALNLPDEHSSPSFIVSHFAPLCLSRPRRLPFPPPAHSLRELRPRDRLPIGEEEGEVATLLRITDDNIRAQSYVNDNDNLCANEQ